MKLRVTVQTPPNTIGDGDNERVMVQPGMNPVRQGGCAVAARGRRAGEKRR